MMQRLIIWACLSMTVIPSGSVSPKSNHRDLQSHILFEEADGWVSNPCWSQYDQAMRHSGSSVVDMFHCIQIKWKNWPTFLCETKSLTALKLHQVLLHNNWDKVQGSAPRSLCIGDRSRSSDRRGQLHSNHGLCWEILLTQENPRLKSCLLIIPPHGTCI
jgi:hypothetical protein